MRKILPLLVLLAACSGSPSEPTTPRIVGTFVAREFSLVLPPGDTFHLHPGTDTIAIRFASNGTMDGTAHVNGGTSQDPIFAINRRMNGRYNLSGHYITILLDNYYAANDGTRGLDGWVAEAIWTWNGGDTIRFATPVASSIPVVGFMVRTH